MQLYPLRLFSNAVLPTVSTILNKQKKKKINERFAEVSSRNDGGKASLSAPRRGVGGGVALRWLREICIRRSGTEEEYGEKCRLLPDGLGISICHKESGDR
ncbi:hypothetical protein V5799_023246 [Amblyomma americanum]|uniref:Uncharacterized protein n=1 Tax=Amblyomma americanum TaxID=6943 RepID=A0AAQ4FJT7_AMBAM